MTTKAKEAPAAVGLSDVQYDASAEQDIPLTLHQNGKDYDVRHRLGPLSDERFFKYTERHEAMEKTVAKKGELSTYVHAPKIDLWDDIAQGVTGYKKREDFKAGVHFSHKKEAIDGLLTVRFPDDDAEAAEEGWDIDATIKVEFHTMYSGALLTGMSHSFRPESKEEMDEFMALEFNQPDRTKIASAKRTSQSEKLAELGRALLVETEGYKPGTEVPAWHLSQTVEMFFIRQLRQAGK